MDVGPHFSSARGLQLQRCPCLSSDRMDPHPQAGVPLCPWTCPKIMGLCLTPVTWLRPSPDRGLQNGFPACPQTCLITTNLPDGPWAAPGLPCSPAGAVGLVPAARPGPGEPPPLLAPRPSVTPQSWAGACPNERTSPASAHNQHTGPAAVGTSRSQYQLAQL